MFKQTALALLIGPPALCYVSVNAGLWLTLGTLLVILSFEDNALYLLLASFPVAAVLGLLLVYYHNRKIAIREFSLSTYIGRVSCKFDHKSPVQRSYHKSLSRARLKNQIVKHQPTVLGILCTVIITWIAAPNLVNRLAMYKNLAWRTKVASDNSDPLPEKKPANVKLPDSGMWTVDVINNNQVSAVLKADDYQKNSNNITYRPKLILSCTDNKTTLKFETAEILGTEKALIKMAFSNNKVKQKHWNVTADYQSALAPDPINTAREIRDHSQVEVFFNPFETNAPKTTHFDLHNSRDIVREIAERCSW